MPRVLILHASVGSGHRSAALALQEAFRRRPDTEARVEDTLDYATPLFREAYRRSYLDLTDRAPMLWQMFYQNTDISDPEAIELANRLRTLVERLGGIQLRQLIRDYRPAAVVCTHFLPVELLLRHKEAGRLPQPVYCVITDYVAHSFWLTSGLDGYFVATDVTRDLMAERGVEPSHIYVTGIPVNPQIAEPKDAAVVRAAHGYATDEPLITLFGGGIPVPRVRRMVTELLKSDICGTLVVAAGRSEGLAQAIAKLDSGPRLRLQVLEHISYVDDLVAASDLVITKPGGLMVSEVLARGTPMLLIDPIPGQEEWNADYIATTGSGVQLRMPESVARAAQSLLQNPSRLLALRESARQTGRPRAACDIAERVLHALR